MVSRLKVLILSMIKPMKQLLTILCLVLLSSYSYSEETLTLACEHEKTDFYDLENNIEETKTNLQSKSIILDLENKTVTTGQGKISFKEREVEIWWQYRNEMPATDGFKAVKSYWFHNLDRISGSYFVQESFCIEGRLPCTIRWDEYFKCSKKEKIF